MSKLDIVDGSKMMKLISAPPSPHTFLSYSSWGVSCYQNINYNNTQMRARDRVIDFGKYKGKMLGTLSSEYLRWMSKNLNTDNFKKWGKLAEDVLEDEVYADRMEWEVAEKLLSGDQGGAGVGVAGELEEMSNRFGWDYNDKHGWSKVDFKLLGTSMGGRLPRRRRVQDQYYKELEMKKKKKTISISGVGGAGVERGRRRDRAAKKREQQQMIGVGGKKETTKEEMNYNNNNNTEERNDDADANREMVRRRQFPGRQSLINKVGGIVD